MSERPREICLVVDWLTEAQNNACMASSGITGYLTPLITFGITGKVVLWSHIHFPLCRMFDRNSEFLTKLPKGRKKGLLGQQEDPTYVGNMKTVCFIRDTVSICQDMSYKSFVVCPLIWEHISTVVHERVYAARFFIPLVTRDALS